eukprot:15747-Heterococcus_DN1.PRE.1
MPSVHTELQMVASDRCLRCSNVQCDALGLINEPAAAAAVTLAAAVAAVRLQRGQKCLQLRFYDYTSTGANISCS